MKSRKRGREEKADTETNTEEIPDYKPAFMVSKIKKIVQEDEAVGKLSSETVTVFCLLRKSKSNSTLYNCPF